MDTATQVEKPVSASAGPSRAAPGTTAKETPQRRAAGEPRRELPALAQRVLIIGLDGATFDILDPLRAGGYMPNLDRLARTGVAGILESTKPPITPAAWTTFMTGKGPGRHGIVDFEKYDFQTNRLSFNSTFEIREKTIWEILSEKMFRVGSINLPMTYPPRPVNGFMISGFETPSVASEFTYPPDLKEAILQRWPHYNYGTDWHRKTFGGDELFQRNLRYIEESFRQGCELTTFCGQRYGWDVLMVLYKLVDNLQHKAWKYLDPQTSFRYPRRAEMAARSFAVLDRALGELEAFARQHEAAIVIMSDHGHGSMDGKAQPNLLLRQWGFLGTKSRLTQAKTRALRIIDRARGKKIKRFDANLGVEHELAVDWSRTRACVVHAGMYGFLYLNVKDRQPGGLVEWKDYEPLRDELIERFRSVRVTDWRGQSIEAFAEVHKTEKLYNCSRDEHPWLPDLLLIPATGLAVVRRIRGSSPVQWCPRHHLHGTHRVEGILVVNGPHIRQGASIQANIADITPTILAAVGLRVPADMEGKVLTELFDTRLSVEYEPPQAFEVAEHEEVYTEEEKEALTRRLSDLGYLE